MEKLKCILIGDSDVGKTTLANLIYNQRIPDFTSPTIGLSYFTRTFEFDKKYMLQVWDTAGAERYRAMVKIYFRNTQLALIVFDKNNPKSFENILFWYESLLECNPILPKLILIGNKTDLPSQISTKQIKSMVEEYNFLYFEFSKFDPHVHDKIYSMFESILPNTIPKNSTIFIENDDQPTKYCCYF